MKRMSFCTALVPASTAALVLAAALAASQPVRAQTLNSVDRGWYRNDGSHTPGNDNYIVGDNGTGDLYHNFFVFDLPTLTAGQTYLSATLRFYTYTVETNDPSETYALRDYSGSIAALSNGTGGVGAYNDLADGNAYGSIDLTPAQSSQFVTVALNSSALSDINAAAGGMFALGGFISTLDGVRNQEDVANGSGSGTPADTYTQLILTHSAGAAGAPEPGSLSLLGMGLVSGAGMTGAIRRRRWGRKG